MNVKRIGLDLAKTVFERYGVDEHEQRVLGKSVRCGKLLETLARRRPCVVGMEACGGAHHWAREPRRLGHEPRLMAPQFVAPYRKNDRNDAAAIGEAVGRPNMRFMPIKEAEQQAVLTLHRARALLISGCTALVNHIRGLLSEYGLVFAELAARLRECDARLGEYDRHIAESAQRLMQVEGVGPLTATAITATVGDARQFRNGRQFAAWVGLVARQRSSAAKVRRGRITKRGDVYRRILLLHGARALMRHLAGRDDRNSRWALALRERRGFNKAALALAGKHARVLWALLAHGSKYQLAGA